MSIAKMGITFITTYLSACYEIIFFAHMMLIFQLKPCYNIRLAN